MSLRKHISENPLASYAMSARGVQLSVQTTMGLTWLRFT